MSRIKCFEMSQDFTLLSAGVVGTIKRHLKGSEEERWESNRLGLGGSTHE